MFPKLAPQEIDRLRRFGEISPLRSRRGPVRDGRYRTRHVRADQGSVRVTRRDPLGHSAPIVEHGPGEFVAEVGQLSGQPAFVDVHAIDDVEALLIPSAKSARPDDRGGRTRRTDHSRPDPASCRPDRGWRRWSGPDWSRVQSGRDSSARFSGPQCVSASIARPGARSGRSETGPAICPGSLGPAAGGVSEGYDPEKPERGRIGAHAWHGADRRTGSNL